MNKMIHAVDCLTCLIERLLFLTSAGMVASRAVFLDEKCSFIYQYETSCEPNTIIQVWGGGGGGYGVVVSTAAFHAKARGSFPGFGGLKGTKLFLLHRLVKLSIEKSVRDREVACSASRPPGFEFRILCLEGSVISLILQYSGGSPGPI